MKTPLNDINTNRPNVCLWQTSTTIRTSRLEILGANRNQDQDVDGFLHTLLRRSQGQVRARVFGIRVPARWQASLREQLQLQERHDDPQRGIRAPVRDGGAEANHPGFRDHARGRLAVAAAGPRWSAGVGNCHW